MARRLNKRLLVNLLVFLVFPVAVAVVVLVLVVRPGGNPDPYVAAAKANLEKGETVKAWINIRQALREGGGKKPEIQYLAAQIAMKQPQPAVRYALQFYRNAVTLKKDYFEAQRDLAELYILMRRWKDARAEIDRLLVIDPTFGKGYVWGAVVELGEAEMEQDRAKRAPFYEAAVARCEEGIKNAPDTVPLYQVLVQTYEKMEKPDKVLETLDLAIEKNPKLPDAYAMKAVWLAQNNKADEALKVLKQGLEQVGDNAPLFTAAADVLLKKKEVEPAKEYLQKAIKADPKLESAYVRLAGLKRMENAPADALALLQQGLQALPESVALRVEVADVYLDQRDTEKAEAAIKDLEKTSPEDASVSYLRGKQALMNRRAQEATALLQRSCEKRPTPQARFLLGQAYNMAGEVGAGARELGALVADLPDWAAPRRALAETQFQLRDYPKAAANASKVLESQANDTAMRLLLARTLLVQKQREAALKEIQKAAELAPNDPGPHLMVADLLQKDQPQQAEVALRRAVATGKDLAVSYRRLILFYRDTNQKDKLAQTIEEVNKALPDSGYTITAGSPQELEKELKKRIEEDPSRTIDALNLARIYQTTDRPKEAEEILEGLLGKLAKDSNEWRVAWQQEFTLYVTGGQYDKAGKLVDRLKEVDPQAPEAAFANALIALSQDKIDEAIPLLREALERRATSQGYFLLGQTLARQQKYDDAITQFQKAVELKPDLAAAHLSLARVFMIRADYAGAALEAGETLKYAPRLVAAMELQAAAHVGEGAWASAIDVREKIRSIAPENINNLVVLAALYRQQRTPEKAEKVLADAYQRAPDNPELVPRFADFYAQTGRPEKGAALLDDYVKRNPGKSDALVLRADFAARIAGPAEAEKYYRQAADLSPDDPGPLVTMGDQYGRARQWDAALKAYQEAAKRAKDKEATSIQLRIADVHMLKGELEPGMKIVNDVLSKDPKNAPALVVGGRILAKQDQRDKAVEWFQKAAALSPAYGEAKFRLARALMSSDPVKSLDLLAAVDPADLAFERAMLLRAAINNRRGLPKESVLDLRRLLDFRPESQEARALLASLYLATRDPGRAAQVIQAMLANRPGDPSLMVFLGDALYEKRDYREALEQYSEARRWSPNLPNALIGEAKSLVALNRKAEAIKRVEDVMNSRPVEETWPRLALVTVYELSGEPSKAAEALVMGLQANPKWDAGRLRLADILVKAKQYTQARGVLTDGLKLQPDSVAMRTDLARIQMVLNEPEAARQLLEPVAKRFEAERLQSFDEAEQLGQYVGPLSAYSLALYRLGRTPEAIKVAKTVWNLAPTDVANSNNLAWMLATEQKALPEATALIRQILRLMPDNPQVLDTAGWIAYLRGDYEQAAEYLVLSTKQGDNPDARYHLGRTYEARERPEDACDQYKEAVKLGLAGKDLDDAKRRLKRLGKE